MVGYWYEQAKIVKPEETIQGQQQEAQAQLNFTKPSPLSSTTASQDLVWAQEEFVRQYNNILMQLNEVMGDDTGDWKQMADKKIQLAADRVQVIDSMLALLGSDSETVRHNSNHIADKVVLEKFKLDTTALHAQSIALKASLSRKRHRVNQRKGIDPSVARKKRDEAERVVTEPSAI